MSLQIQTYRINSAVVVGMVRRLFSLALVELIVKPCFSAWEAGDNFSDGEKCQTYQTWKMLL